MSYDTLPVPEPVPASDFIKPIETRYAGCRFRSRLEARWAVFFDALDIEWQYEPEGYIVADKPYLPDFWLPGLNLWVEVKGVIDQPTLDYLVEATDPANGLPATPDGERWHESQATGRILVLGQVPHLKGCGWTHTRLDFDHGDPCWRGVTFMRWIETDMSVCAIGDGEPFVGAASAPIFDAKLLGSTFVNGAPGRFLKINDQVNAAYRAARSARFEYGESGAPKPLPVELPKPASSARKRRKALDLEPQEVPVQDSVPTLLHPAPVRATKTTRTRRPVVSRKSAKEPLTSSPP